MFLTGDLSTSERPVSSGRIQSIDHELRSDVSDFDYDVCSGFRMNVCDTHQSAMNRVVTEAVKIEKCSRPTMNRKTGYRANSVLRLTSSLTSERNTQQMLRIARRIQAR